jgi:prepilin-type processing-associated H-X9-DG protein/prepilin-type N-terminal cleavage/methylation domain-containing protein
MPSFNKLQPPSGVRDYRKAFTLVEVLAVVVIVVILMALLLPVISNMIERGHSTRCVANLRQLGAGALAVAAENGGSLPTSMVGQSWQTRIAAVLNIQLQPGFVPGEPKSAPTIFRCPNVGDDPAPQRSYGLNFQLGDRVGTTDDRLAAIAKPSRAALLADTLGSSWLNSSPNGLSYRHPGKTANVFFVDGHVEALTREQVLARRTAEFFFGQP